LNGMRGAITYTAMQFVCSLRTKHRGHAMTAWFLLELALAACSGENRHLRGTAPDGADGRDPDSDPSHDESDADEAGATDAGGGLSVSFRAKGLSGDVIQLACGEPCVEAEVIVQGGTPPYALRWGDGATASKREVCAGDGPLELSVEDSGDPTDEFGAQQRSADATLGVENASCSDAGPGGCHVVTSVRGAGGCNEGGHDTEIRLPTMLPPGDYEFRYEMTVVGEGQFAAYALGGNCQKSGPELGRVEFSGAPIGGTKRSASTCGKITEETTGIFLDQMIPVWGGAFIDVTTVCEGCPSRGK
jgi:hypothetical protein